MEPQAPDPGRRSVGEDGFSDGPGGNDGRFRGIDGDDARRGLYPRRTVGIVLTVEWAIVGVLDAAVDFNWVAQPAEPGTYRTEISWQAPAGTAATITSTLRGWDRLRFEVTEEPTAVTEGARYSYTPDLGVFHAMTGLHGDILIPEDRVRRSGSRRPRARSRWTRLWMRCSAPNGTPNWSRSGTPVRRPGALAASGDLTFS